MLGTPSKTGSGTTINDMAQNFGIKSEWAQIVDLAIPRLISPLHCIALHCIVLYLLPLLNPKSYDGARVLEASGRPVLNSPTCAAEF